MQATAGLAAAAEAASGTNGDTSGCYTIERDVVFPGCPLNSSPGRNKDNSQCIMCGEHMPGLKSCMQPESANMIPGRATSLPQGLLASSCAITVPVAVCRLLHNIPSWGCLHFK
jgi:hypothetical protein